MESLELQRRIDRSYEKYGWTKKQIETFERFMEERYANYKKPENTLRSYLDLLNQIVFKIMSRLPSSSMIASLRLQGSSREKRNTGSDHVVPS